MRKYVGLLVAAAVLASCGGESGGGGGGTTPPSGSSSGGQTGSQVTEPDAARLAQQATFGPTQTVIEDIRRLGVNAWLDQQFGLRTSNYTSLAGNPVAANICNALTGQAASDCRRDNFGPLRVQMQFYQNVMANEDQLRQRVAFALSQIIVVSEVEVDNTAGLASFQQLLLDNAFGNYRDLLRAITLHPYMGDFLDMVDSRRTGPNQNFARELLQLFSIYVSELNTDGTKRLNASGQEIPTYTEQDVLEVARALTGWTYARLNGAPITDNNQRDYTRPMIVNTANFDTGAKSFLGTSVPANATAEQNVDAVINAIMNNPNIGPFISYQLIQHLVTSNPSPAYVSRVVAVFNNNGSGVKGDLRAVVRAILTDAEARGDSKTESSYGKLQEPVLLMTGVMRALSARTDGYVMAVRDGALGQQPYEAPSVFNFYPWDYPLPGSTTLESPPAKLMSTSTIHARHNLVYDWTVSGDATRTEYQPFSGITGSTGTQVDWAPWETLAANPDQLIDRLDLLFMNRTMSTAQKDAIRAAMTAITNADATVQARRRAQVAMYVVASSLQSQTDR
jgi:uncharacterized protein (DUF1800 family)